MINSLYRFRKSSSQQESNNWHKGLEKAETKTNRQTVFIECVFSDKPLQILAAKASMARPTDKIKNDAVSKNPPLSSLSKLLIYLTGKPT